MTKTSRFYSVSFLLYILFNSLFAFGQKHYGEGSIVTNAGDTLLGFIEVRETDINPAAITFKLSIDSEPKDYQVSDIMYFDVKGVAAYQRFNTSISMNPLDLRKVDGYQAPPSVRNTVFLKIMQRGPLITLLSYRDRLKVRFYILEKGTQEPQELVYRFVRMGANYKENFAFRDQLQFAAQRAGILTNQLSTWIKKSIYSEGSLLRVIRRLNGIEEEKTRGYDKASTGLIFGAGINVAKLYYYGNEPYATNAQSSPSTGYWCSIGYDLTKNPRVGALVFRGDITLHSSELSTITYDYTYSTKVDIRHSFKQRSVGLGLNILYNLYNHENLKFFISAGVRTNFSFYHTQYLLTTAYAGQTDTYANEDAEPSRVWSSIPLKIGGTIRKKFELGVTYSPTRVISHGNFPYKFGIITTQFGIVYHL